MNTPKFYKGRAIIQPGETYLIDGVLFEVITATSEIIGTSEDSVEMTELVFTLDNEKTGERVRMKESELQSKFKDPNQLLH